MKKKIIPLIVCFCAVVALSFSAFAVESEQNPVAFSGDVDFWEDEVGSNVMDTTGDKAAYINWNEKESTDNMYVWFTVKSQSNNSSKVTAKTKMTYQSPKTIDSEAIKGRAYKLVAAREYILDFETYLAGTWAP